MDGDDMDGDDTPTAGGRSFRALGGGPSPSDSSPVFDPRGNASAAPGQSTVPNCQVLGCESSLAGLREYYQRYKICQQHLKAEHVPGPGGEPQRFCQLCGRFHPLNAFDDNKRSCRARLIRHNERRKRRVMGLLAKNASAAAAATDTPTSSEAAAAGPGPGVGGGTEYASSLAAQLAVFADLQCGGQQLQGAAAEPLQLLGSGGGSGGGWQLQSAGPSKASSSSSQELRGSGRMAGGQPPSQRQQQQHGGAEGDLPRWDPKGGQQWSWPKAPTGLDKFAGAMEGPGQLLKEELQYYQEVGPTQQYGGQLGLGSEQYDEFNLQHLRLQEAGGQLQQRGAGGGFGVAQPLQQPQQQQQQQLSLGKQGQDKASIMASLERMGMMRGTPLLGIQEAAECLGPGSGGGRSTNNSFPMLGASEQLSLAPPLQQAMPSSYAAVSSFFASLAPQQGGHGGGGGLQLSHQLPAARPSTWPPNPLKQELDFMQGDMPGLSEEPPAVAAGMRAELQAQFPQWHTGGGAGGICSRPFSGQPTPSSFLEQQLQWQQPRKAAHVWPHSGGSGCGSVGDGGAGADGLPQFMFGEVPAAKLPKLGDAQGPGIQGRGVRVLGGDQTLEALWETIQTD